MHIPRQVFTLFVLLSLLVVCIPAEAAEEHTVKMTSAWVGQGRFIPVGDNKAFFVGTFSGILFAEKDEGQLHTGKILCPGTLELDLNEGKQEGEGRCLIADADGNQVFARWTCTGVHLIECKGRFEITGGTGRFQGITGASDFRVRSGLAEWALGEVGEGVEETAAGLAEWPALTYRIP
jgi:hypothetical protein